MSTSNALELAGGTSQAGRGMGELGPAAPKRRVLAKQREWLRNSDAKLGPVPLAPGKWIDASYGFNQYIDNLSHLTIYLAKKERRASTLKALRDEVDAGRMTKAEYEAHAAWEPSPEQQVATALRVAGDFTNAPAYQIKYLRRAVPFIAWYKHITRLTLGLPIENPFRAMWMFHLAQLADDPENRPAFLKGALELPGGGFLNMANLNPIPGGGLDSPLLSPQGWIGSSAPPLQGVGMLGNYNAQQGRMMSWAPGYGPTDEYGRPDTMTPIFGAPGAGGAMLEWAGDQVPGVRLLRDSFRDPVARYDSGQPIVRGSRPIESSRQGEQIGPINTGALLGYLGVSVEDVDAEELMDREGKRLKDTRRKRSKYDRRLERSGL
jgi:hypothetical protein